MLTFYHSPQSRSTRVLGAILDMGVEDRLSIREVTIPRVDGSGARDPSNPHPDGKVPCLDHDGVLITETTAVLIYLTEIFSEAGLGVAPGDPRRGAFLTWMAWYGGVMEPVLILQAAGIDHPYLTAAMRGPAEVQARLEAALAKGPWLMGDRYTVADAVCHSPYAFLPEATPDVPSIRDWIRHCTEQPGAAEAVRRDMAARTD